MYIANTNTNTLRVARAKNAEQEADYIKIVTLSEYCRDEHVFIHQMA